MAKRKKRGKVKKKGVDFMKPLDIEAFTEENDPCFGKHHSLKAKECANCGDAEICVIITAQDLRGERDALAVTGNYKEFHDEPAKKVVRKFIKKKIKKGKSDKAIIKLAQKKWAIDQGKLLKIITNIRKKLK